MSPEERKQRVAAFLREAIQKRRERDLDDWEPFQYEGRQLYRNIRGDVVTQQMNWVGRLRKGKIDTTVAVPKDIDIEESEEVVKKREQEEKERKKAAAKAKPPREDTKEEDLKKPQNQPIKSFGIGGKGKEAPIDTINFDSPAQVLGFVVAIAANIYEGKAKFPHFKKDLAVPNEEDPDEGEPVMKYTFTLPSYYSQFWAKSKPSGIKLPYGERIWERKYVSDDLSYTLTPGKGKIVWNYGSEGDEDPFSVLFSHAKERMKKLNPKK